MLKPENVIGVEIIKVVLSHIKDGFQFEAIVKRLLQEKYGWKFTPAGGIHDGGADALVYFGKSNQEIYQVSIQKTWNAKIKKTVDALQKNNLLKSSVRLSYITPLEIPPLESSDLTEEMAALGIVLLIKDLNFITNLINSSVALRTIFCDFCNQYGFINQLNLESTKIFGSKHTDKTIVFLKHFIDEAGSHDFVESMIKTNFFLALIATDPDKEIFLSKHEILDFINKAAPNISRIKIAEILNDLVEFNKMQNKDAREFRDHKDKYCLSYVVRQKVMNWQAHDLNIYDRFVTALLQQIAKKQNVDEAKAKALLIPELVRDGLSEIFRYQGLSFMSLIVGADTNTFSLELPEVVQQVVSESDLDPKLHSEVVNICSDALYELIWKPTADQKEYLNAMAKTYALMFTGKADMQVLENLKHTAKGSMFLLGTDLIVKLLSEIYLDKEYQRFTNLIRSLGTLGVKIFVNANILHEATSHLKKTARWHEEYVGPFESEALRNPDYEAVVEFEERYSKLILIRAYHHAKSNGKVKNLKEYFSEFVSGNIMDSPLDENLKDYLAGGFGISTIAEFIDEDSSQFKWMQGQVDSVAYSGLSDDHKAKIVKNDSQTILSVYQLRSKHPGNDNMIFSQKVWWLTTETKIERLKSSLKEKFGEMPNMSPLAVLALLSNISELEKSSHGIGEILSSALGLNMSHFVENEVLENLHLTFQGITGMSEGKKKVIMGQIAEKLRTGKVRQIKELAKPIFDQAADDAKALEPYYLIRSSGGFRAVWEALKAGYQDPGQRLKYLSVLMDSSLKEAGKWLITNGYQADMTEIASIMVKLIEGPPPLDQ